MFKCCAFVIIFSSVAGLWPSTSYGFDPTTIAKGLESAGGIAGGLEAFDEAASVGFALGDLLEELGLENDSEEELEKAVNELEQINSKARDLRWADQSVKQLLEFDLKRGRSLASKIKAMRNLISTSKKVAAIFGIRTKAGEKAVKIQEIKISSMILEELQAMRRAQYLAYLEDQKLKTNRELMLSEIEQSRGKGYGIQNRRKIQ